MKYYKNAIFVEFIDYQALMYSLRVPILSKLNLHDRKIKSKRRIKFNNFPLINLDLTSLLSKIDPNQEA